MLGRVTNNLSFEEKLHNYARLAVRVGLGVREGQRVLVQAPVDTAPLARLIVREAYAAGASFVDVRWDDDDVQLARFSLAPDGSFEQISKWRVDAELETAEAGGAVVEVHDALDDGEAQTGATGAPASPSSSSITRALLRRAAS